MYGWGIPGIQKTTNYFHFLAIFPKYSFEKSHTKGFFELSFGENFNFNSELNEYVSGLRRSSVTTSLMPPGNYMSMSIC